MIFNIGKTGGIPDRCAARFLFVMSFGFSDGVIILGKRDNRLYELRCNRKLSQGVVGDMLNLSQTRVSAYERGESIPSEILKLFACFYGVTTDYILRLSDNKSSTSCNELFGSEDQLLIFYRGLSQECKQVIDVMVDNLIKVQQGQTMAVHKRR